MRADNEIMCSVQMGLGLETVNIFGATALSCSK